MVTAIRGNIPGIEVAAASIIAQDLFRRRLPLHHPCRPRLGVAPRHRDHVRLHRVIKNMVIQARNIRIARENEAIRDIVIDDTVQVVVVEIGTIAHVQEIVPVVTRRVNIIIVQIEMQRCLKLKPMKKRVN